MPIPGYILAGGKSSRFGSDKARAILDEYPLIVQVAERAQRVCGEILVIADGTNKYDDLGLPTIADLRPGLGPLAGVEAALADQLARRGPGWTIIVSCDFAGLKVEWLETIVRHLSDHADAVAFRNDFWQPFPAAYHTNLLPGVSQLLDEGRASFQKLLDRQLTRTDALPLPNDWPTVVQVNTTDELKSFLMNRKDGQSTDLK